MFQRQLDFAQKRLATAEEEKRQVSSVCRELLLQAKRGILSKDPTLPTHFEKVAREEKARLEEEGENCGKWTTDEPVERTPPVQVAIRHTNAKIAAVKEALTSLNEMRCYLLQEGGFGDQVFTDGVLGNATNPTFAKKRVKEIEAMGYVDGYAEDSNYYTFACEPPEAVVMEYTARELAEMMSDEEPDDSDLEFSDDEDLELESEEEDEDDPLAGGWGAANAGIGRTTWCSEQR